MEALPFPLPLVFVLATTPPLVLAMVTSLDDLLSFEFEADVDFDFGRRSPVSSDEILPEAWNASWTL